MAKSSEATNEVYYSLDEGSSFEKFSLGETKVEVSKILSQPGSSGDSFILLGTINDEGNGTA
jgi:hypothetical protein